MMLRYSNCYLNTQLLKDGFPLFGGFSSGLSVMQIPPLDLKQFEIIKGSASTLYGGGAIAGLVNLVSKTPDYEPDLDLMFTQTSALGSTLNAFYSKRNDKYGVSLYASGNYQKVFDPEDDGFSNLPETTSINFNPKFYYYPSDDTTFWIGLNATYDDRIGGDVDKIENGQNGIHQYTEENISKRLSSQLVYTTKLDSARVFTIKNSDGKVVKKEFKTPKEGVQRFHWDLRYTLPNPIDLSKSSFYNSWESSDEGDLVASGTYTIQMDMFKDGKLGGCMSCTPTEGNSCGC